HAQRFRQPIRLHIQRPAQPYNDNYVHYIGTWALGTWQRDEYGDRYGDTADYRIKRPPSAFCIRNLDKLTHSNTHTKLSNV
ncbi:MULTISPECIES: hypothetical protein, partial [unclassified Sulfitobacter]|uniref:hypothetical protein n=1 Tax=unclassified Sulfitobacter TaxID=196795 RepID=UPI0037476194